LRASQKVLKITFHHFCNQNLKITSDFGALIGQSCLLSEFFESFYFIWPRNGCA